MKFLALIATLTLSITAFAKTPATQAVKSLINEGTYKGLTSEGAECSMTVILSDMATVSIRTEDSFATFSILNSSDSYVTNEQTGEFQASLALRYPRYQQGGTKLLNVRNVNGQIEAYIAEIYLDHQGNEDGKFLSCVVSK